jgi:hypothetical protein
VVRTVLRSSTRYTGTARVSEAMLYRSLDVMCFGCRHEVIINVDDYPGDLLVKDFGPRTVCTKCAMVGADV